MNCDTPLIVFVVITGLNVCGLTFDWALKLTGHTTITDYVRTTSPGGVAVGAIIIGLQAIAGVALIMHFSPPAQR